MSVTISETIELEQVLTGTAQKVQEKEIVTLEHGLTEKRTEKDYTFGQTASTSTGNGKKMKDKVRLKRLVKTRLEN